MRIVSVLFLLIFPLLALAQPPLNKRLQKEKEAFEALILAEEKYDSLITAADQAFQAKDYLLARMTYEDAIPYNAEKEQWLISKVNDLDILMAKNAAREVDSILVALPSQPQVKSVQTSRETKGVEQRTAPEPKAIDLPKPDSVTTPQEEKNVVEQPVEVEKKPEDPEPKEQVVESAQLPNPPAAKPQSKPVPEPKKEKVKEDFSSFDNGITEETFNLDNHTVERIVVKDGIDVIVFKRVKHNWGGEFYFLDDVGTTKRYWTEQVEKYRAKYGE